MGIPVTVNVSDEDRARIDRLTTLLAQVVTLVRETAGTKELVVRLALEDKPTPAV
jgi:hypothetical protein